MITQTQTLKQQSILTLAAFEGRVLKYQIKQVTDYENNGVVTLYVQLPCDWKYVLQVLHYASKSCYFCGQTSCFKAFSLNFEISSSPIQQILKSAPDQLKRTLINEQNQDENFTLADYIAQQCTLSNYLLQENFRSHRKHMLCKSRTTQKRVRDFKMAEPSR